MRAEPDQCSKHKAGGSSGHLRRVSSMELPKDSPKAADKLTRHVVCVREREGDREGKGEGGEAIAMLLQRK